MSKRKDKQGFDYFKLSEEEESSRKRKDATLHQKIEKKLKKYARPPLPENYYDDDIVFQVVDVDYTTMEVGVKTAEVRGNGKIPIVKIYGVNMQGNSVCANIVNFFPYFYARKLDGNFDPNQLDALRVHLNQYAAELANSGSNWKYGLHKEYVMGLEIVKSSSIDGLQEGSNQQYIKITLAEPAYVTPLRTLLMQGLTVYDKRIRFQTYDSNVLFIMRYMYDNKISGGCWLKIHKGSFEKAGMIDRLSTCQCEVYASCSGLESLGCDGEWEKNAPIRTLSFDTEWAGRKGIFPNGKEDPIIQISMVIGTLGSKKQDKILLNIRSCDKINGTDVICFDDNDFRGLLIAWRNFIVDSIDPDIITGHNIEGFDLPNMLDKADVVGEYKRKIGYLSRDRTFLCKFNNNQFSSKQSGKNSAKELMCPGRIILDTLRVIKREHKLRSYTLNKLSAHFLKDQKEDIHHSQITPLFNGTSTDRQRLGIYCVKDAILPLKLIDKLCLIYNFTEMARATGVVIRQLIFSGQSIKVMSCIYWKCNDANVRVPFYEYKEAEELDDGYESDAEEEGKKKKKKGALYGGATVLKPKKGYYDKAVPTEDFASLYPSIMIDHNLCYTTRILDLEEFLKKYGPDDYEVSPSTEKPGYFAKSHVKKGILPTILEELLAKRQKAKDELKVVVKTLLALDKEKTEKGSSPELEEKIEAAQSRYNVLDGRQLAMKITANSVYGFTGASVGKLPCLEISSAVTAYGRLMIEAIKEHIESKFTQENGYHVLAGPNKKGVEVIYGDTDSVMVHTGLDDVTEAMKLGIIMADSATEYVYQKFKLKKGGFTKLAFEKVYKPYLLISKKRYAGVKYLNVGPADNPKPRLEGLEAKGIESVRRDNCLFMSNCIADSLDVLMNQANIEGAKQVVRNAVKELLNGRVDMSQLVITKSYSRPESEYKAKQAHVELAKRMKIRDPGSAPTVGDRVPYVVVAGSKGAKTYEKIEDPIYVMENEVPIDYQYYIENQLEKPVTRIFGAFMKNPKELLYSDTMKKQTSGSYGIMSYTIKYDKCEFCGIMIRDSNDSGKNNSLCSNCIGREPEIYQLLTDRLNHHESKFHKLWTECQRCQGDYTREVICGSKECPRFYARKDAIKKVRDVQHKLENFGEFSGSMDW